MTKSAGCSAGGSARRRSDRRNPALKRDFNQIEKRLPGRRETEIVVAAVVPVVVDIETLDIEVADVNVIAVRVDYLPAPIHNPLVCGTRP